MPIMIGLAVMFSQLNITVSSPHNIHTEVWILFSTYDSHDRILSFNSR